MKQKSSIKNSQISAYGSSSISINNQSSDFSYDTFIAMLKKINNFYRLSKITVYFKNEKNEVTSLAERSSLENKQQQYDMSQQYIDLIEEAVEYKGDVIYKYISSLRPKDKPIYVNLKSILHAEFSQLIHEGFSIDKILNIKLSEYNKGIKDGNITSREIVFFMIFMCDLL
ncbi:hypothetical protein LISE100100_10405 [Listeria seeligeri]|uniref:hypothetical protein n=1 Tax=Listeria seeligeri TaxID=1640 RepID=UPI0001C4EB2E|nr:hypothetical protein [Listeria seeligeri]MBC1723450.1 hypothetical protein [Listeria seeligeri]MBF2436480.1 hypothetical protein [Listeria seeligeri]CBH28201.1 hypothetical protein lse_2050 [Listeria seeligeri serovar 1/2b str. SLCC3954]